MVKAGDQDLILSRRKSICALFPYVTCLEQHGSLEIVDIILRAAMISSSRGFVWRRVEETLLAESSPPTLDWAIVLVSPYLPWRDTWYNGSAIDRWAAAVSAFTYIEAVGVVDALLQVSSNDSLRSTIPVGVWSLLKMRPSLPPVCRGRSWGARPEVVRYVRGLGDIEILVSYLLLTWSEWEPLSGPITNEMEISIREDLCRIGMWQQREDLIKRLDHILRQLGRGSEYLEPHGHGMDRNAVNQATEQYTKLRNVLLEVEGETTNTLDLTRMSPK